MAAISTVVLDGLGLERGADLLAELDVAEVEVAYIEGYMPFDESTFTARTGQQVAALFAGHGIAMRAVSAHTDLGREDGLDRLLRRIDFAVGAGIGTVISNATTRTARPALMRTLEAGLPRLADAGVVLALENPGHGRDALLPDGAAGAAFAASWDSPWLRLNYDIGNAHTYAQGRIDLAADLAAALPHAQRLHLKDVVEVGGDWHFCPLGSGEVGYGTQITWPLLAGRDLTVEHPLRLWRPGRRDPVRRADIPSEAAVRAAIAASLAALPPFAG